MLEEKEEIVIENFDESSIIEEDYDEVIIEENDNDEILVEENNGLTFEKKSNSDMKTSVEKDYFSVGKFFHNVNSVLANDYIFLIVTVFVFMFLKKDKLIEKSYSSERIRFNALSLFFIIIAISLPLQFKNGMFYYLYLIVAFVFFAELRKNYKRIKFDNAVKESFNIKDKVSIDFDSIVKKLIDDTRNVIKGDK